MSGQTEPKVCIECGEFMNLNPDGWCGECVLDEEVHIDAEAGRSEKAVAESDFINKKVSEKFGWPPPAIMSEPEPLVVDLVEEGKAIAGVMASVSTLPGHSIRRVIHAVNGLVGLEDATARYTMMPNGKITSWPLKGEDAEVASALNRLSIIQGDGDESAP